MNFRRQGMDGDQRLMIAFSARITGGGLDILADDDDGQQHQLQERLGDPTHDDNRAPRRNRRRKRDEGNQGEQICTPHGPDGFSNGYRNPGVKTTDQAITMDGFVDMMA